jgi:hypothetical protein
LKIRVVNESFEKYCRYWYRITDIRQKSIADTDIDIEIEKYRRYRYSTNRYFCKDAKVTGDIRRFIGGSDAVT